jgi:hypothetical protein
MTVWDDRDVRCGRAVCGGVEPGERGGVHVRAADGSGCWRTSMPNTDRMAVTELRMLRESEGVADSDTVRLGC